MATRSASVFGGPRRRLMAAVEAAVGDRVPKDVVHSVVMAYAAPTIALLLGKASDGRFLMLFDVDRCVTVGRWTLPDNVCAARGCKLGHEVYVCPKTGCVVLSDVVHNRAALYQMLDLPEGEKRAVLMDSIVRGAVRFSRSQSKWVVGSRSTNGLKCKTAPFWLMSDRATPTRRQVLPGVMHSDFNVRPIAFKVPPAGWSSNCVHCVRHPTNPDYILSMEIEPAGGSVSVRLHSICSGSGSEDPEWEAKLPVPPRVRGVRQYFLESSPAVNTRWEKLGGLAVVAVATSLPPTTSSSATAVHVQALRVDTGETVASSVISEAGYVSFQLLNNAVLCAMFPLAGREFFWRPEAPPDIKTTSAVHFLRAWAAPTAFMAATTAGLCVATMPESYAIYDVAIHHPVPLLVGRIPSAELAVLALL